MMKGFFINPATAAPGQGPQMTVAEEGQKLRLAARVYNYSLQGLPAGSTVKVRFYAHQLSGEGSKIWLDGGCTLIGEDSVPLPDPANFKFRSDSQVTAPANRLMAETEFDTTGRGGQYLMFWVVAWAEDAGGTLIPELEQHGLTSKPPDGCPIGDAQHQSVLGMPIEFYSNNVGVYQQPFYVMPKPQARAAAPRLAATEPAQAFSIGALSVSPANGAPPYAGEQWELVAPLLAGSEDRLSVHLVHAGSGPGGHVSYTGLVPFIAAGTTYADKVPFRPLWCGPHTAVVTARPGFQKEESATLAFDIACRPEDVSSFLADVITDASLAGVIRVNKTGQVEERYAAIQNAVLTAEQLARKGSKTGACQQYAQALARIPPVATGPVAQLLMDIIGNARGQLGCR